MSHEGSRQDVSGEVFGTSGSWLSAHPPLQQAAGAGRAAPSSTLDPQRVETDTALSSQRFIF